MKPTTIPELAALLADRKGGRSAAIAALAESLARHFGGSLQGRSLPLVDAHPLAEPHDLALDDALAAPATLGQVYELLLAADERRDGGAHFTPPGLATGLVAAAVQAWDPPTDCRILDPSSGGGVFLIAAAEWLVDRFGLSRRRAVEQILGRDLDPLAVAVSELTLALWCLAGGEEPVQSGRCSVADALIDPMPEVDLIVGNPPFLSQLASSTVRSEAARQAVKDRFGSLGGAYTDTSALFIPAALEAMRPGGRLVLIQPQSLLAARDVERIRNLVTDQHRLCGLWFCAEPVFAASVRVCAPIIECCVPGAEPAALVALQRWQGSDVAAAPSIAARSTSSWGPLVADLAGIPTVAFHRSSERTIGSLASTTAGFRDEFYGFAPHTIEADGETPDRHRPAAVTVGMVDALRLRWGTGEFRYAGNRWTHPIVNLEAVKQDNENLYRWATARLAPKLLMATQTKVIEVAADIEGSILPITPVVAIEPLDPEPDVVWRLAAALSAPAVSALAFAERIGSALAVTALKLSATDVASLPLPTDDGAWADGAAASRAAQNATTADDWSAAMHEVGAAMNAAYGVSDDDDVFAWWFDRLPGFR